MPGPLAGVRVIDCSAIVSGPFATMMLADQGADVVKVEPPGLGDFMRIGPFRRGNQSAFFMNCNRGKRGICIDLRKPEGRDVLKDLVRGADVFVQNFRPGAVDRMGIGEKDLRAVNPDLVYVSISGFGESGPYAKRRVYDPIIQGLTGHVAIQKNPEFPVPDLVRNVVADKASAMWVAQAVTAALFARERGAGGQLVDIAMLDSTVALLTYQAAAYFATSTPPSRMGNRHPTIVPYETFVAADGEFVLAVGNDDLWRKCCRVIGLDSMAEDPRYATNRDRVAHYPELRAALDARLRTRPRTEWLAALTAEGVPCGSVRDIGQVLQDQQLRDRDMLATVAHAALGSVRVLGTPVKLSDTPGSVRTAPPILGQHTDQILHADLRVSREEIAALRADGVI